MARKTWGALSENYRKRLERGGITKQAYESGASLSAARGHAATPERPERALKGRNASNPKYNKYREKLRNKAYWVGKAIDYTHKAIGDLPRYDHGNVVERANRKTIEQLKRTLKLTRDELRFLYTRDPGNNKNVWWYH